MSIIIFTSVFIFLNLRNTDVGNSALQLTPQNYLYKEKFGDVSSYSTRDISTSGNIINVRVNQKPGSSEPVIKQSPKEKNSFVISANEFSEKAGFARVFTSEDYGINWVPREIPLPAKIRKSTYSDPYMDYDSEGNLYFTAVQIDIEKNYREAIFIASSSDNGNTWKSDFNYVDYNVKENIELDRPKIYVDKSNVNRNVIYVTWIEEKGFNSFVMLSKSYDKGNSFSAPEKVDYNEVDYCSAVTNSKGELFVTYLKDDSRIIVKKSVDEGQSWKKDILDLKINPAGVRIENQYLLKNSKVRINSEPSVKISADDDILITYSAKGEGSDLADVYFVKISSAGNEVSSPLRVNTDNTFSDQFLPVIDCDESGKIAVMYLDSRNDINNMLTDTYVSISKDGGKNFEDEKISLRSYDASKVSVERYIGDYNSCLLLNDKLIGVWTDGRNDNIDLYAGILLTKKN